MQNLSLQSERRFGLNLAELATAAAVTADDATAATSSSLHMIVDVAYISGSAEAGHPFSNQNDNNNVVFLLTSTGWLIRFCRVRQTVVWKCHLDPVVVAALEAEEADDDEEEEVTDKSNLASYWFSVHYTTNSTASADDSSSTEPCLICLNRNGTILSVPLSATTTTIQSDNSNNNLERMELVGSFEFGLEAAAWSPDGQVLLLVTVMMNDDEQEEDKEQQQQPATEQQHRSVLLALRNGDWQVLAEVDMEPHVPTTGTSTTDSDDDASTNTNADGVSLEWRPDGAWCAVSSVDISDKKARKIRIYHGTTLALASIGRMENGSGQLIPNLVHGGSSSRMMAWAGAGCSHLLATVQRKGKSKQQVALIESNGLQHGEFVLSGISKTTTVLGLTWNHATTASTQLLAVWLRDDDQDKIQLWHRSNYHWYLQREMVYASKISTVQFVQPFELTVALYNNSGASLTWREYNVKWQTASIHPDTATALVVDGTQLHITPLDRALVPPPYSSLQHAMAACISEICFVTKQPDDDMIASSMLLLADGSLAVLGPEGSKTLNKQKPPTIRDWKPPVLQATARFQDTTMTVKQQQQQEEVLVLDPTSLCNLVLLETTTTASSSTLRLLAVGSCRSRSLETNNDSVLKEVERLVIFSLSWNQNADEGQQQQGGGGKAVLEEILAPPPESPILTMIPWADAPNDGSVLIQLQDGRLFEYNHNADCASSPNLVPSPAEPLLEPCPWIAALKHPAKLSSSNNGAEVDDQLRLVFGQSSTADRAGGRFYCHDLLLAESISSFYLSVAQQYVCYTTAESRCQLRSLPLTQLLASSSVVMMDDPLLAGADEQYHLTVGYEPRSVERGARLVAVSPVKPTAVLQMPRGNLELVYPRALVLCHAMKHILGQNYKQALELMRRQKVDLNLIVDMDPNYFLNEGVEVFLDQVENVDYLNLFISLLQNWDSTQERYPVPSWIRQESPDDAGDTATEKLQSFDFTTKVNRVCQRMRSVMIQAEATGMTGSGRDVDKGAFLLPILSTFAKEDPPKLEEALSLIKEDALKVHPTTSKKPPLFSDKAQHSIQYLAFLAEYELLFNRALGQYDYDMARAVARNSQMDPKFYLPLLKRYRELPPSYARYQVDMRLQRYDAALRNLAKSSSLGESVDEINSAAGGVQQEQDDGLLSAGNGFEDCMLLIEQHGLHRLGLELFQEDETRVQRIMLSLGDRLMKDKKAVTALHVFLAAPTLDEARAKQAARVAKDWVTFFSLHGNSNSSSSDNEQEDFDREKLKLLAHDVADELAASAEGTPEKQSLLTSASRILLDYGQDVDGAIDMLIRAERWAEGERTARLFGKENLARKCLDAAVSYAQSTILDLEERSEEFQTTMARYSVVLEIRKQAIASGEAQDEGDGVLLQGGDDDAGSLFSAASNVTNTSLSSTASTGTVGSLSSVISAKSQTSFTLTGATESNRHKSKFNQQGTKKKKKKKKKTGRNRIRPGSHAELLELVATLKRICVDDTYRKTIAEAIAFLSHHAGHWPTARALYTSYVTFGKQLEASQQERIAVAQKNNDLAAGGGEGNGGMRPAIVLQVEAQVEPLGCQSLPDTVTELFALVPEGVFST